MIKCSLCRKPTEKNEGFTLTELTIVLVIITLLVGGLMVPLSAQQDAQRTKETQKYLSDVREALMGFAIINCRLPCPAKSALATGDAGAGIADPANGNCSGAALEGVIPWATLGVPETDAWGRRLKYRVTEKFAKSATCTPGATAFTLNDNGAISVLSTSGGNAVASQLPAIILSHSKNGFSAYLPNGEQVAASSDADEQENTNGNDTFVSKTATPTFDDLIEWISPNILKSRMITAGRLP